MQFGKSIRIYLKDGNVTGLKIGEVVNQTIQCISCPRVKVVELASNIECKRPGVYFLLGTDEEINEPKAYIGEAENVYDRLQYHIANKDFWNEVIIIVSKDENLTKSHVRYLESRLIQISNSINRYKIENANQTQLSSLPPADRDAMEEFLTYIKLLLGVFGHKLLEEKLVLSKKSTEVIDPNSSLPIVTPIANEDLELFLKNAGITASAIQTNEGLVVLKGSEAAKESMPGLSIGYKDLRDKLIQSQQIQLVENKFIFQDNVVFDSPSQAGATILGYNVNGRVTWKDKSGKTLKEIEEQRLKQINVN
jgi:hypothetical protein